MEARSSVFDLARKLLEVGDRALLDAPLAALSARMNDPVARDSLDDVDAAGLFATLREALEEDRLDRFAAESCTQREEEALCHTLLTLLGGSAAHGGDDDLTRLVRLPEPTWERRALRAWAREHGVRKQLDTPVDELLGRSGGPPDLTLETCVLGEDDILNSGQSVLAAGDLRDRARARLVEYAKKTAAREARHILWSREPAPQLKQLHGRLAALVKDMRPSEHLTRFVPARPVQVQTRQAVASGSLHAGVTETCDVRVFLSGYEQRGLAGHCARCGEGVCGHVRALGARLLDALLDERDRLHAPLREVASRPSWERFVDLLHEGEEETPAKEHGTLAFRLAQRDQKLMVTAFLQRPARGRKRASSRALPAARAMRSPAATDRDRAVLEAMLGSGRPLSTQSVPADVPLLRALTEHPRVEFGDDSVRVRVAETELEVDFAEQGDGLMPTVRLAGSVLARKAPPLEQHYFLRYARSSDTVHFAPVTAPIRRLLGALSSYRGVLPAESFDALGPFVASLRQVARVQAPEALRAKELAPVRRLLLRLSIDVGDALHVALSSRPLPLGALWNPGHGPEVVHGLSEGKSVLTRRDLDWERENAKVVIATLDLTKHIELEPYLYRIEGDVAVLEMLRSTVSLTDILDLEWSEKARRYTLSPTITSSALNVRLWKRGHWLEVEGDAVSGETQVAVAKLLDAAKRGERFVRIEGNTFAEIEGALLHKLQVAQGLTLPDKNALKMPAVAGPWLADALALKHGDAGTTAWLARAAGREAEGAETELPTLSVPLRSYQAAGVRWLTSLSRWAPGACLADDMGLGKTLQATALLSLRAELGPALVVAPTSVTDNFLAELTRFAPELRAVAYRGDKRRALLRKLGPSDVVVVSYDILQRDVDEFADCHFATQVLDEAQWLKNARTGRAKAVRSVPADFRLALSGTPIENRLGDLWSLMDLVAPGLLGPWARFRSLFAVPIERYEDKDRLQVLRDLCAPFILRRTKKDVERDLPARIEVVHRVELSKAERELYTAAANRARENLKKRKKHDNVRATHVLADLTQLRQLACHPRLVIDRSDVESSKLAALMDLLDDLLPRGHRALIFSQFVRHLTLVREALDARKRPYLYLDGSTPAAERANIVERYQAGEAPLFLISLKAGGAGLNLTAADYVFHMDPWWNPATEDQASDRAHRLGQDRPVTILKLIAAGTLEERVLALHEQKRELAGGLLDDRGRPVPFDLTTLESLVES